MSSDLMQQTGGVLWGRVCCGIGDPLAQVCVWLCACGQIALGSRRRFSARVGGQGPGGDGDQALRGASDHSAASGAVA